MKKIQSCTDENCIPNVTSCSEWNGGDIEALGICNGDSLNNIVWEIVSKLEEIAGEDISSFDIEDLLSICNVKAPAETTLLSILTLLKNSDVCLKSYIDSLNEAINELSQEQAISINLKCFADIDNLGNILAITRPQLDQLIIDNLCSQKGRIDTLEGEVTNLQSQINNIDLNTTVDELSFATCINANVLPTSTQVINTSNELCDLESATGNSGDISTSLASTPGDLNTEFGAISGWILTPANWAENYNNLLLEVENLRQRIASIEQNCCATTCKDVELGFSVIFNEDKTGIIIRFTSGAGTDIPADFSDNGSTGTITDKNGAVQDFTIPIANGSETEVSIVGLDMTGDLILSITAILTNGSITCEKCLGKTIKTVGVCDFCQVCASGTTGTVTIVYDDAGGAIAFESFNPTTTTTTTSI